jgi:hypothetical protein
MEKQSASEILQPGIAQFIESREHRIGFAQKPTAHPAPSVQGPYRRVPPHVRDFLGKAGKAIEVIDVTESMSRCVNDHIVRGRRKPRQHAGCPAAAAVQ